MNLKGLTTITIKNMNNESCPKILSSQKQRKKRRGF